MTIALLPLMSIAVRVGPPRTISTDVPGRRFIPITGGVVTGSLTGEVLNGGGDWQRVAADGTLDISAHYILDIAGHGLVEVRSDGLRHAKPDILAALNRNEAVDPSHYYFRTAMRFHTNATELLRLNHIIALATGRREQGQVHLDIFEVG